MILTRKWSVFLVLAGLFNWVVWPRFAVAIWQDPRAWQAEIGASTPTSFLWVHAVLIGSALAVGSVVAVLGVRGLMALRHTNGHPQVGGRPPQPSAPDDRVAGR